MLFARALSNAVAFFAPETAHSPRAIPDLTDLLPAEGAAAELPAPSASPPSADVAGAEVGTPAPTSPPPQPTTDTTVVESTAAEILGDPDRRCTQAQAKLLRRVYDEMADDDRDARFLEVLNIVGAPDGDEIAQRVVGMNEVQADEAIQQLGQYVNPRRSRQHA